MRLTRRRVAAFLLTPIFGAVGLVAPGAQSTQQARPTKPPRREPGPNEPTNTPGPNEPTATSVPTFTPIPTDTPAPTFTPFPTDTPAPTATLVPTETAVPTATLVPTDTPVPTETATLTPTTTPTVTPTPTPGGSLPPVPVDRVLLNRYAFRPASGSPNYNKTAYRPHGFVAGAVVADPSWGAFTVVNAGPYAGWDLHPTLNDGIQRQQTGADWLVLTLNRAATVAVVWRDGNPVPPVIAGWTRGADVVVHGKVGSQEADRTHPVYVTTVPAGDVALPGVNAGTGVTAARNVYWVLLAEASGHPDLAPDSSVAANQTCPFHPPNWHPQIDRTHWCYHRHEHGTDPAYFSALPPPVFGATAAAMGMVEPNPGFKVYVFDDQRGGRWRIVQHFGTAGQARVCARHHTLEIAVMDRASGALLADLRFMGDYGKAVVGDNNAIIYTPSACPDQGNAPSNGRRKIPMAPSGTGYEPWHFDSAGNVLGMRGDFIINTPDQITMCADAICDSVVVRGTNSGTNRFWLRRGVGPDFGIVDPGHGGDGHFLTDPTGRELRAAGDPGALAQFVAPGLDWRNTGLPGGGPEGHCFDTLGWEQPFSCGPGTGGTSIEREDSIPTGGPN